jgi:LacI family transcriptional regulator
VIGLHDFPMAEVCVPPLTVVKMPLYEMGFRATLALISLLQGTTGLMVPEVLPPIGVVRRASTSVPPKK